MTEDVDLIVIGAGQAGVPLAVEWARNGKNVVLFERNHLGGTCVNVGCTPSKAFLAAAHQAGRARDARAVGVHCDVFVDVKAVMQRIQSIRNDWHDGVARKLASSGVRVVGAEARFTGVRTVSGGTTSVRAPIVAIDTGSSPAVPPIAGLADVPYLTNETFFEQHDLPKRFVVVGAGYIGLELGQGLRRLGCEVTVIDPVERLLAREDEDAAMVVAQALRDDGVDLRTGIGATCATTDNGFSMCLDDGTIIMCDAVLVAAGRKPNSAALDCEASGIEVDARGFITVDPHLRTTCEGVFALGEVAGQPAFTHVVWEDYRRMQAVLAGTMRTRDDRVLGYTTFTEPQLARVGLTETQAQAAGKRTRSATLQLADDARATEWGLQRGLYRIVIDAESDAILGATFVGYEAGEIIHTILAHMEAGSTWRTLERSVHIHPTFSEALPTLVRQFAERPGDIT